MNRKRIPSYILLLIIVAYSLLSKSCGNTAGAPTGGDKDTIPPILLSVSPSQNTTNIPLTKQIIKLTFDEYVVLKDIATNIYLSPPQSKRPQAKIKGKGVQISFQDTLLPNTTYYLNFGHSIVDNNEGNIFPAYAYSFSTGAEIDSLYLTGTINHYETMLPVKRATIALYTTPRDSAVFDQLPSAIGKSDDWGYFTVRNIKDTLYYIYAFDDQNNNNTYDPDNEMIAFLDSVYTPSSVMRDDVYELGSFDMKDTSACMARVSLLNLSLFKEVSSRQFIKDRARTHERAFWITFSAPNVIIDSLYFENLTLDSLAFVKEYNVTRDSLCVWINYQNAIPDTLNLSLTYHGTNSTGKLSPLTEKIKLVNPGTKAQNTTGRRGTYDPNAEKKDTTLKFSMIAPPENIEQNGFVLEFDFPLVQAEFDSISVFYLNPMMQRREENFTIQQDTMSIRRYILRTETPIQAGNDYNIRIPKGIFRDINGYQNDSLLTKVKLPNDETLSTLILDIKSVHTNYIIELLNEKRDKVLRSYKIIEDQKLLFPYLKAEKYSIRITEDKNGNGILDTGSLLERRQPEKVLMYKPGSGNTSEDYLLDIPQRAEIEQTIDLEELFK